MNTDHKGQPSGTNKSEGTGTPGGDNYVENPEQDQRVTERYTDGNGDLGDQVRHNNPNRNTDKTDATNAGGYRN